VPIGVGIPRRLTPKFPERASQLGQHRPPVHAGGLCIGTASLLGLRGLEFQVHVRLKSLDDFGERHGHAPMDNRINRLIEEMHQLVHLFEYSDDKNVRLLIHNLQPAQARGYLTADELYDIARIKSPRRAQEVKRNTAAEIAQLTESAFSISSPVAAVAILTALQGVGVPTASAILAWTFPAKFGVIDQRAWASLQKFKILEGSRKRKMWFSLADWRLYHDQIINIASKATRILDSIITPQSVDLWLYHYDQTRKT